MSFFVR